MEKLDDQHVKKVFIKNKVGDLKYTDRLYIIQISINVGIISIQV